MAIEPAPLMEELILFLWYFVIPVQGRIWKTLPQMQHDHSDFWNHVEQV